MFFGGKENRTFNVRILINTKSNFVSISSGREGYMSLLNTDVRKELDHLAAFLRMAVEHKKKIGFQGQLLIEPKPKEPTKHQCETKNYILSNYENTFYHVDF